MTITKLFLEMSGKASISLMSFGHSFGIPKQVDFLYSARHLSSDTIKNLKRYDGRQKGIQNQLLYLEEYENFINQIMEQLKSFLTDYKDKTITIAIGCEKGQHRSVAIVERLHEILVEDFDVLRIHRDLGRSRFNKIKQQERRENRDTKYRAFEDN